MNWRIICCISFIITGKIYGQISSGPPAVQIVDQIIVEGNKITKEKVILRELPFTLFDTITGDLDLITRSAKENIFNLQLFNEVSVDIVPLQSNRVLILIQVVEQWYYFPIPVLEFEERNFNVWWENKNFDRTSTGLRFRARNFRGRAEKLALTFKVGYLKHLGIDYFLPGIDAKQKFGISVGAFYLERSEVNFGSTNNVQEFYKSDEGRLLHEQQYHIGLRYRRAYDWYHFILLKFNNELVNDDFALEIPDYLNNNRNKLSYFSLSYRIVYDTRDNSSYPLKGNYLELNTIQYGLNSTENEPQVFSAILNFRKYWKIKPRVHFQSGLGLKGSLYNKLPYTLQRGFGYQETFVRGYQDYVMDGQHYGLLRNNIKFTLIPTKIVRIPFIASNQINRFQYGLFVNLFSDIGYVVDDLYGDTNPLSNEFLFGNGIGLDFITSYNRVIRFEFAVTKTGQTGIFLNFSNSI